MLVSEFVDKYAGSVWLKSYQHLDAGSLQAESSVARKMQNVFWLNYGVQIAPAAVEGYYTYDYETAKFKGLNLATKKEVAMFTLFLVRYCFAEATTLQFYFDFLDKFSLEYPEVSDAIKSFKEDVLAKSKIS